MPHTQYDPYVVEHEFYPGDEVYVVLQKHTVRYAKVIQVDIKLYEKEDAVVVDINYLVLLQHSQNAQMENTERVQIDQIFRTVDEALDAVRRKFIPGIT